ncbi:hypothetical protein B0T22DRAFT_367786 [Podospora appendiculata]|uniref:Uncharacterized protein n=1 Tax=Podospora appendiculata TaxID=314037 RepID=A0AAE1C6V6_9PEZI|nr:hypothetical protein B0T22DRAFT_389054 [Podospora appendiculata]KAK3695227.1 hypothetical protein B0T22DRAFT_367786 [Podospora appendiculata]
MVSAHDPGASRGASQAAEPPQSEQLEVVETPTSPSSALALSRFEFETGKGNEGTKILMVEWNTSMAAQAASSNGDGDSRRNSSDWEVSWEGKTTVLPIRDSDPDTDGGNTRRVYFLLPPGSPVPGLVSIAHLGAGPQRDTSRSVVLHTRPMPAIFPAELGGGRESGRCGVLHSIWAKKRLAELQGEIATEMKTNGEGVGLEMAMQERQWIVDHFGLAPGQDVPKPTRLHIPQAPAIGPASPRSPVGGKLGEKLRGLKLGTSPAELSAASQAARSAQPRPSSSSSSLFTTTFSSDPPGVAVIQVASLDAMVGSGTPQPFQQGNDEATEDELFALPMSPRSPEMKRSPFSLL